ncbi:glycosyltransferase family 2 protein, partial [Candidatus Woesearchaeota archaeon]|nr:glycosyltransferase family 2 protein [Candidatus Woesearchaeota archaeon]
MIQNILWAVSFFSLWLVLIWLQVMYLEEPKKHRCKETPLVTIAIAAYNEERTIEKTISSIAKADYPKDKIEIIVVNDGSRDRTADVVEELIKKYPDFGIKLISKPNGGKASAINRALEAAKGELFGVVDADSRISPNCMRMMAPYFAEKNLGAVISRIKVDKPNKLLERIQRFEYIMSNMIRKLMASIGTLALTPGVLSIYRTKLIRELGGFDENRANLTEDLEIAMRLKYNGYDVKMESESIVYTVVPKTIKGLWRQRIRWARGYIYNHVKYKDMFFSRKHSLFGVFQMPVNILVLILLIINVSIISWAFLS